MKKNKYIVLIFIIFLSSKGFCNEFDSLKKEYEFRIKKSLYDSKTIDILLRIVTVDPSYSIKNAYIYFDEALKINEKYNLKKDRDIYFNLANIYVRFGHFNLAIENINKGLELAIKEKNNRLIVASYLYLGNIFYEKKMFELALKTYKMSIEYFVENEQGVKLLQAVCYNNIALCFNELNINSKLDSINIYIQKGLELRKKLGDSLLIAHSFYYLSDFNKNNDINKSKKYIDEAWHLINNYKNTLITKEDADYALVSILSSRAKIGIQLSNKKIVEECTLFLDSMKNTSSIKHIVERKWLRSLAEAYIEKKNYLLAFEFYQKAFNITLDIENNLYLIESYKDIANINKLLNNREEYIKFSELYYNLKDSLDNTELIGYLNKITETEARIEFEKSKEKINLENSKDKLLKSIIIAVSISFALIGGLIALILYRKNKTSSDLNKNLKELNATKDKFFAIIAHDLKNPIANMIQISSVLESDYDQLTEVERKEFIDAIDKSSNQVFNLLENLLTWSISQRGKLEFHPTENDFYFIVNSTIELLHQSAIVKHIIIANNIDNGTIANFDSNMMLTVCRNLVSNAIKYTPRGGTISISKYSDDNFLFIQISDNGIGIEPKRLTTIFNTETTQSTPGTNDERGTGLGLVICKEFIAKHKGEISVESQVGVGTTFTFSIPL